MQRTAQLNGLGTLAAVAVLASGLAQAATLTIDSGDVIWGSSGTGTARISYATYTDAYYLNNDTSSKWISGYGNGVVSQSNAKWYDESWSHTLFICGNDNGKDPTVITWNVNTSGQQIQALTIYNQTLVGADGDYSTSATWEVSTNGTDWTTYVSLTSPSSDGTTHDLTTYVSGYSNFYIRTTLNHYWSATTPQIFRTGESINYGLDVNMTVMAVPEPASLGLLALGGLFVLRRRR